MKVLRILILSLIFTLVSGLYVQRHLIIDAVSIGYGFPFQWLQIGKGSFHPQPWVFTFLWFVFLFDFAVYGLLIATAVFVYEKKLRRIGNLKTNRIFLWSFSLGLVACLLFTITWILRVSNFQTIPYENIHFQVQSFWHFVIGELAVVFTWIVIKYRKQFSH